MTENRKALLVFGLIAAPGIVLLALALRESSEIRFLSKLWDAYSPPSHTFDVSGYVTDEYGHDVPGAFLSISEHTWGLNGPRAERNSDQEDVKTFHVKSDGYHALSLSFSKLGYEGPHLQFNKDTIQSGIHVVMRPGRTPTTQSTTKPQRP